MLMSAGPSHAITGISAAGAACTSRMRVVGKAARPGRAQVVAGERIDEARTADARAIGEVRQGQRDRRQQRAAQQRPRRRRIPAAAGQPVQGHREDQHQQGRDHELRHRQAESRQEHQHAIDCAAPSQRGEQAERDADAERQRQRDPAAQHGHRQAERDQLAHAVVRILERWPEVATGDVAQPVDVLRWQRPVEPVLCGESGGLSSTSGGAGFLRVEGAARGGVEQREAQRGEQPQGEVRLRRVRGRGGGSS